MRKVTAFLIARRKLSIWAGLIGPLLFIAIFTLEGCFRPDYNPIGMYVSELSLGPRGWIQIVNFIIFGTLFLIFTLGIAAEFREGKASRSGPLLFMIIAICILLSGPFVMDPVTTLPDQMSWHGILHDILGAIVFVLSPVSCFIFLRRFHDDLKWHSFYWWTLVAGIIISSAVIIMTIGEKNLIAKPNVINDMIGIIQRTVLIPYLIWLFTIALGLLRQNKSN